ncbi:MAG TPA: glycosyltransferase family 39 protein [Verrucomicrobiae bacterium]|nr:glycosyltransferase family 39 protein [Verrucomicrobiae bacterium]
MSLGAFCSSGHPARRTAIALIFLVLLTAAIRMPLLNLPFERDEGEYAYIAWRMNFHELPYRDWVDQKPPGVFWVYRLALSLPLNATVAVHLMGFLFSAATACALFFLAGNFMSRFWALAAATLFVFLSADPLLYGQSANTELFMLLPLVASQIVFLSRAAKGRREISSAVWTGILIGIASAFKQVAAINWFFLVAVFPIFARGERESRRTLFFAAWSALGVAMVWGIIGAYFAARHGFGDFIYDVFTHNFAYVSALSWSKRWDYFLTTFRSLARDEWLVWLFSIAGFIVQAATGRKRHFLFLLGWTISSGIGVCASGYFFPHYFQQILPVLCLTAAMGAEASVQFVRTRFFVWLGRVAMAVVLVMLPAIVIAPFLFVYSPAEAIEKIYPGNHFDVKRQLAARLAQITAPDDKVFVFGADPEILFYAHRVSATRYIFLFPLFGPYPDAKAEQMATTDEVMRHHPAAICYLPNTLFFGSGTSQYLTQWTRKYMAENFRVDTYLAYDQTGSVRIVSDVPAQSPSVLAGLRVFGKIDLRKPAIPSVK